MKIFNLVHIAFTVAAGFATVSSAHAEDKVRVGVFGSSSALPYFVGVDRGFFRRRSSWQTGRPGAPDRRAGCIVRHIVLTGRGLLSWEHLALTISCGRRSSRFTLIGIRRPRTSRR